MSDGEGLVSTDRLVLSTSLVAPVANAGNDRAITLGASVVLDGAQSYSQTGDALGFAWTLDVPDESSVALTDPLSVRPSFVPDVEGEYRASLIVTDGFGASSTLDNVVFSTDNLPPLVQAGKDQVGQIGDNFILDPSGTYDPNGELLKFSWNLLHRPDGSSVLIEPSDADGRLSLTTDVAGDYVLQLTAIDEGGLSATDQFVIRAETADSLLQPAASDFLPVANAGPDRVVTLNDNAELSAVSSYDVDGELLSYQWSILSAPEDSNAELENASSVIAGLTPDVAGLYVLQVRVNDGVSGSDIDTVVLSTDVNLSPVSQIGGDFLLTAGRSSLDGGLSFDPDLEPQALSYQWAGSSFTLLENAQSDQDEDETSVPASVSGSSLDILSRYGLVVFEDLDAGSEIRGRTLVGGNVVGNSSTYGSRILDGERDDILTVVGNIQGGPKNINNGYSVTVGGQAQTHINLNGGGQLRTGADVSIDAERAVLIGLSESLAGTAANSTASIPEPNGQHGPARLQSTPDAAGVAVFNVEGSRLFSNDRVQQIELFDNGASTVIVNVSGQNINFNRGNFTGQIYQDSVRRKVIWNFHEATNLRFERHFNGAVLAPNAHLFNQSQIDGTVFVRSMQVRGSLGLPSFSGEGLSIETDGEGDETVDQGPAAETGCLLYTSPSPRDRG